MRAAGVVAAGTGVLAGARLALFVGAATLGLLSSQGFAPETATAALALAAVALAVWHGAFDGVLAEEVFAPRGWRSWRPVFYSCYVALAGGVLLLWWAAPGMALVGFLLYSAFHFGTEGETRLSPWRLVAGLAAGFVPIAAACHWWAGEVATIFGLMLRGEQGAAGVITQLAGRGLWPAVAIAAVASWQRRREEGVPGVLLVMELALFRFCSPLTAFAVFFCLWHTPEHMVSTSLDRAGRFQPRLLAQHLRRGLAPWLLSLAAVAVACWFGRHTVQAYTGTLFIFLSALTVPHMLLAELYRRAERAIGQRQRTVPVRREAVAGTR